MWLVSIKLEWKYIMKIIFHTFEDKKGCGEIAVSSIII